VFNAAFERAIERILVRRIEEVLAE